MKRIVSVIVSILMIISVFSMVLPPSFAGTSVSAAKTAYKNALRNETKAKAAYDKAYATYNKGSYGFYQWIIDNYDGWMETDAREALTLLSITSYKEYTVQGNEKDATSLENMKSAVDLLPTLVKDRANDEFHPNLPPVTIRNVYMARAQVNANVSSYTGKHTYDDPGCVLEDGNELGSSGENLAWGYNNPFYGWYDMEKENFIAERNYTLKKYGVDINSEEWLMYLYRDDFDYNAYLRETEQFGVTGHYHMVVCGRRDEYEFSPAPELERISARFEMLDRVFFGLGYSQYGGCHSLVNAGEDYNEGYSVDEYTKLFYKYYKSVYPSEELAAYNEAKDLVKSTLKTLKASAKAKKPAARRTKKVVTVKWNKVAGVSGYQISVSEKKGKTKIAAKVGKKTSTKKIKLKKSKSQYVKIRSYVIVNGKKVYSNWSKPVKTR